MAITSEVLESKDCQHNAVTSSEQSHRYLSCVDGNVAEFGSILVWRFVNPISTLALFLQFKRLLGRNWSDREVQQELQNAPYKAIRGENDTILIEVQTSSVSGIF